MLLASLNEGSDAREETGQEVRVGEEEEVVELKISICLDVVADACGARGCQKRWR